jgi:hypothetical protein
VRLAERPRLLTAEEYSTLRIDARTELLRGFVYDMSPATGDAHRYATNVLAALLNQALFPRYCAQANDSVAVPDWEGNDAPRPDVAVITNRYEAPTAADTFAFIEVSDTSYRRDRGYKIPLYVDAGVPSYIVNIDKRQVEFYGSPAHLELPSGIVYSYDSSFEILGVRIEVAGLFQPAEPR